MIRIDKWTGIETRALRQAKRMSLRAFSEHLRVTERTTSLWEQKGADAIIRQVNQAGLDTLLQVSGTVVHERMAKSLGLPFDPDRAEDAVNGEHPDELLLTQ